MKRKHFDPVTVSSDVETPTKRYKSRVNGKFYTGYCGSPDWEYDISEEMKRNPKTFGPNTGVNQPPKGIHKDVMI